MWVPDPTHEAMRDLVRARTAAMEAVRRARQQLQGFLLRHGRVFTGRKRAVVAGAPALAGRAALRAPGRSRSCCRSSSTRSTRPSAAATAWTAQIRELVPGWSLAPVVAALQAMRGVALLSAVVLAAEVGDFRRFASPAS